MRWSARVSAIGAFSGVLIPGAVLLALAALSLWQGRPSHLDLNPATLIPDLTHLGTLTFGVSVLLAFAGMEMSAAHAREVRHPARTYPLAIGIAAGVILVIFVLGSLAIAVALPAGAFDLQTGVTQAIAAMLRPFGLEPLTRLVALLMALGVIGSVNSWIVGPSKGLLVAGERGELPTALLPCNRHGVPVRILLLQGLIVSLLCLSFSLQPSVASAYFMLSDLTIQLYLVMYLLLFLAALKLRRDRPEVPQPFRVPALWLICGLGIIGALVAIGVGFFPPAQFGALQIDPAMFVGFLLVGMLSVMIFPVILHGLMRRAVRTL
ncbi:APC family permease [Thiorhodovibrio litoralis]|uniref:APC family permease n=1 Tax=Thiorhodovibrio litoralis TaxID=2952932 RepID=UPI001913A7A4|nr:APC family permease [Thiorhodovibrio litoralis]WPL11936.1 Glutamate/gamma-aminobutyrate antiporter [Thiorhodovibrio litoralis]